jgi:hypothetical protein
MGREAAQGYAKEALDTLVALMHGAASEHVRLSAATAVLNRAYGRPRPEDPTPEEAETVREAMTVKVVFVSPDGRECESVDEMRAQAQTGTPATVEPAPSPSAEPPSPPEPDAMAERLAMLEYGPPARNPAGAFRPEPPPAAGSAPEPEPTPPRRPRWSPRGGPYDWMA